MKKALPIGVDDYRRLKENNYYAVDKTLMIEEFLQRQSIVTLITRPRRFGKTLNMSMIQLFFYHLLMQKETKSMLYNRSKNN